MTTRNQILKKIKIGGSAKSGHIIVIGIVDSATTKVGREMYYIYITNKRKPKGGGPRF
jgi:hypothetical protein